MTIICALLVHWHTIRTLHNEDPIQSIMCVTLDDIPREFRKNVEVTPNITVHHSDNQTSFCGDADMVLKWVSELVINSLNSRLT